ncbi:MAG TPA: hypothetical protein VEQ38_02285 [Verrucomicrobiae bacterium]|nr:hypothetical protein [Verrucomicrobiae bacterium]
MKRVTACIVLLVCLLVGCFKDVDETDCNDDARRRIVKGDKEKAKRLYASIQGKFPSWDKNFHEEEFTYVGSLKNGTEAALLITSLGTSTCRGTTRLLLFQNGKYFGCLNGMDPVDGTLIKVVGNKLIFPYTEGSNEIDLSDVIPPGLEFMPAD